MNKLFLVLKWSFVSLIVVPATASRAGGQNPFDMADVSPHTFAAKEINRSAADASSYGSPVTSVFGDAKGALPSFEAKRRSGAGAVKFADELGAAERRQRLAEEDRAVQRLRDSHHDPRGKWPGRASSPGVPGRPEIVVEKPVPGVTCASEAGNSIGCSTGF
ncbi:MULTISPECIES: hypothetical protein [Burkholderia]|uniref:DUF4148 domain-containing protein n=1 Tax=Burkholderia mayonis TaxID=1385591 RepID=A0A1B4FL86_9BURK|nr:MULTISPECIES: hypothetical protein [Burkholderia]AOJ04439.1 hypothetical protein WS70_21660 [Burkholderia mayonis]KVE37828.1 hypothetical protein WS69_10150 [Burkholderia sp. BDU5]KVE41161.1 hypothetical protein WS70_15310 [Burkholderia mayonis]